MMELRLEEKDASDWSYRGEGAANLILSNTGSSHPFVGQVLRVPKVKKDETNCEELTSYLSEHEWLLWKEDCDLLSAPTREIAKHLYVQYVMCPLLGSNHVDAGIRILVSMDFLKAVERNTLSQRPSWRVDQADVNTQCDYAPLISDHSVFPQHEGLEQSRNTRPLTTVERRDSGNRNTCCSSRDQLPFRSDESLGGPPAVAPVRPSRAVHCSPGLYHARSEHYLTMGSSSNPPLSSESDVHPSPATCLGSQRSSGLESQRCPQSGRRGRGRGPSTTPSFGAVPQQPSRAQTGSSFSCCKNVNDMEEQADECFVSVSWLGYYSMIL